MQYKTSHFTSISTGQLVEIQASFAAVPRGRGKYKMVCRLRSVCILDQSIEQVSCIALIHVWSLVTHFL